MLRFFSLVLGIAFVAGVVPAGPYPASSAVAATSEWSRAKNYKVRLIAARVAQASAGSQVMAGVEVRLASGWKTYWRAPGDSGVPPYFDFAGSTNVKSTTVLFPAPHRYTDESGDALVYERAVVFPVRIERVDSSKPTILKLNFEFGVCEKICIPGSVSLSLTLPSDPTAGGEGALIAMALEQVPRQATHLRENDPRLLEARMITSGDDTRIEFKARYLAGSRGADLFLESPDGLFVPVPQRVSEMKDGVVTFRAKLGRADAAALQGKSLRVTMVGSAGQSEARWQVP